MERSTLLMNGNRGQYTSAPLNNMKNRRPATSVAQVNANRPSAAPRFQWLAGIMAAVLPVLFLLALLIPNAILRWAFLIVTALSLLLMWALGAFVKNARGTLTVIYGALAVVIGLALFMDTQAPETRQSSKMADQGALFTNDNAPPLGIQPGDAQQTPEPVAPAVSGTIVSAAQQQLEKFLGYWAQSQTNEMLKICTPSWVEKQASPQTTLFQLTRNSIPLSYQIENVSGSEGDTSRTITLKIALDNRNGTEPVLNRMQVLMFRVNDTWYVDPQSLGGTPINAASENAQATNMPASTIAPTATPRPQTAESSIKVYYNPDGGKYYHGKSNCPVVSERYWPLTEFNYADLNTQQFKNLIRCTDPECNAPERPAF